jgi:hypothetical protein
VTEQFNPYHAWLDFDAANHNPKYPELLGVPADETDATRVHMAFDRVIAQVRSHKPGGHAAEWAHLIDELKAAQMAAGKMGFAAVVAANQPAIAGVTAGENSPATESAASQSAASQSAESPTAEVDPIMEALGLDDGFTPEFTTPDDDFGDNEPAAVAPNPVPTSVPAVPFPAAAAAPDPAAPTAAPVAGDGLTMTEVAAQRGGGLSGLIIGFASCALMIVILGVGYYLWFGTDETDDEEKVADNTPVARDVDNDKENDLDDQEDNDEGITDGTNTDGNNADGNDSSNADETDKDADPDEKMTTTDDSTTDDSTTPDTAEPTTPKPITPEPEDRELTEDQLKELAETLRSAKAALGAQDIAKSKELLEAAKPMAGTKTHRAMIERLEALTGYVAAFHTSIPKALETLSPGDSFPVGSAIVALVEKKPESVVIHAGGRNREYPLNGLSLGLGLALADQVLEQEAASTKVVKGAFQAVHPRATEEHIQDVRDWWRGAMDEGETIGDLLLVLDDDYARMAGEE